MMASIRTLLIDDDPISREGIANYLRDVAQFEVTEYSRGDEALIHLETTWDEYGVILLDFVLGPPMGGDQVLKEIRLRYPQLPIIVFTGRDPAESIQALGQDAYAYLQRPLDYTEMVKIIRNLAEQDMLFREMAKDMRQILNSDLCLVWRLDKQEHKFRIATWDGETELDEAYRQKVRLDPEDPALLEFLKRGEPIYLSDVTDPQKASKYAYREEAKERGWTSLISIPLFRHQRIIGLIDSYTFNSFKFLDKVHKRSVKSMLRAFARQAAEAVRNAELSNQLQALHGINQILAGTFEEETIIRQILFKGLELVGADFGWLYLIDINTGKLIFKDGRGIPNEVVALERKLGEGITGRVAQEGRALNIPDVSKNPDHISIPGLEVKSEVAIPLRREEQTIGVLTAKSRHRNTFTDDDVTLLMSLAAQAVIVIGRTKLTRHLQQVSRLALVGDYAKLKDYVVEAVRDLTGADVNLWMMSDREEERDQFLRIVASRGNFDQNYLNDAKIPLASEESITVLALTKGHPIVRSDILHNVDKPKFYHPNQAERREWHGYMTIPLIGRGDERLGSLSLYSQEIAKFGSPSVELMQTFANQAAIAFQQQKLLDESQNRLKVLDALQETSLNIVRRLDLGELMLVIIERAANLIAGEHYRSIGAAYWLCDYDRGKAIVEYSSNRIFIGTEVNLHEGLICKVIETGKSQYVNDYPNWPEHVHVFDEQNRIELIQNLIEVPIKKDDKVIAILAITDANGQRRFSEDDIELLERFSDLVAIAIENAKLFEQAERRAQALSSLYRVGQSLLSVYDLQELLGMIAENALDVLEADLVVLYECLEEGEDVRIPPIFRGDDIKAPEVLCTRSLFIPHEESIVFKMLQRSEPCFVSDAKRDWVKAGLLTSDWAKNEKSFINREKIVSSAGIPLHINDETVGVLFINYRSFRQFRPERQERIETFANQAALAIHNARLLHRERMLRQQADTLREVSGVINSALELEEVAGRILDGLYKVIEYRKASMQLIQGDDRILIANRGYSQAAIDEWLLRPISRDPLVSRIITSKKPLILSQTTEVAEWEIRSSTIDVNSWIGLPLFFGEKAIGFMTLDHDQPRFYRESVKDILTLFGGQAAIAIQNARLFEEARRRILYLEVINRIAETINTKLNIEDLLKEVTYQIANTLHCTHCTIFLLQEENDQLWLVPQVTYDVAGNKVSRRFKPGEGLAGWVFEHGQSLVLATASADVRFAPATHLKPGHPRSLLVAPLKVGDRTIGVISADQDKNDWFSGSDRFLLDALAQQMGTAIQRANGLELLQDIGNRIISAQAVDEILELIVSGAIKMTNAISGGIYLISEDGKSVTKSFRHPAEIYHPPSRLGQGQGITHQVVTTGQTVIIPDVQQSSLINPFFRARMRSTIAIPLKLKQKVVGVLDLNDKDLHDFTQAEISILSTLANQAAIAIQNAQLFDDAQHRIRDLEIVNGVVQILSAKLHTEELLQEIAAQITDKLNCTHCTLFFPQKEKGEVLLVPQVTRGQLSEQIMKRRFKSGEGVAGWVFQHGESMVLADVRQDPRFAPATVDLGRPRSMLIAPIKVGDQTIGVISAEQDVFNWFSESDRRLVDTLARHAGIAIERAMGLELLRRTGNQIISNQTVDDTLEQIVSGAIALTNMAAGVIHLISEDSKSVLKSFQFPPDFDYPAPRLDKEEGLTLLVIKTGEAQTVPDIHQDRRANPAIQNDYQSLMAVPLEFEQKVIGVLQLYDSRLHHFTEIEMSLLSTLASQAGIAIQNARLFERIKEQREAQIKAVGDIAGSIAVHNTLEEVLDGILDWTVSLMGEEFKGFVRLLDQERDELITAAVSPGATVRKQYIGIKMGKGVTGLAAQQKAVILVRDVEKELLELTGFEGTRSELAVPMLKGDELIGVINIEHPLVDAFTNDDIKLAEAIAGLAVVAIENARLFKELDERAKRLERLQKITARISAKPSDLEEVLYLILDNLSDIFWGAPCSIRLYEAKKDEFSHRLEKIADKLQEAPDYLPRPEGISRYILKTKTPYYIEDVLSVPHGQLNIPEIRLKQGVRARASLPLLIENDIIGFLHLDMMSPYQFSQDDKRILELFADQAAIAVQNARLFERIQKQQETQVRAVREIALSIAAPKELEEVLNGLLRWTVSLMGEANLAHVRLFDKETNELVIKAFQGEAINEQYIRLPLGKGITGWVAQHRESQLVSDVQKDERYLPGLENTRSEVVVPMLKEGELIGVLNIEHPEVNIFNKSDLELAEAIAGLTVVAIENAELYKALDRRSVQLEKLYEAGLKVSSKLEAQQVLFSIAEVVSELLEADVATIFPYDASHEEFGDGVRAGQVSKILTRPSNQGLAFKIVTGLKPVFKSRQELTSNEQRVIDERPSLSFAGIPLQFEEECVGLLFINYFQNHIFSENEKRVAQLFGLQAAIAIKNARQFEREQTYAKIEERWAEIGQLAGSLAHRIGNKGGMVRLKAYELAEYLDEKSLDDHISRKMIEAIIHNNQYILELSDLLFKPFRASEERLALFNLTLLINGAISNAEIPKEVIVETNYASDLPLVKANRFFIEVFLEIITNAIEAMQNSPKKILTIRTTYDLNWIKVSFTDTGIGIPDEDKSKIFEWFTLRERNTENKHFGFGLWWVRNFLRDIGGDIEVENSDTDTTFMIRLPREET